MKKLLNILVCGGGNASHIIAGLAGRHGNKVFMYNVLSDEVEKFRKAFQKTNNTITTIHGNQKYISKIECIESVPDKIAPLADIVFISIPAFAHAVYFANLAPFLKEGAIMVVQPGASNCQLVAAWNMKDTFKKIIFSATKTLPWACRVDEYGVSATILGLKEVNEIAVTPNKMKEHVSHLVNEVIGCLPITEKGDIVQGKQKLLPDFTPLPNFLSTSIMNINGLVHPAIAYGQFKDWDGKTPYKKHYFMYEDVDEHVQQILEAQDKDILSIKETIKKAHPEVDLKEIFTIHQWYQTVYKDEIKDNSTFAKCISTNKGYQGLKFPMKQVEGGFVPDFTSRYFTEDIPTGTIVIKSIAELFGVHTPCLDKIADWAQKFMGKEYVKNGKCNGKDINETRAVSALGIHSADEFIKMSI